MTIKDIKLNDIGKKLLLTFIFVTPIFFTAKIDVGNSTLRLAQEQVFQIGALILYAVIMLENIYLSCFLLLSCCLYMVHYLCGGEYLMNIFYACIIYQLSYKVINSENVEQVFKIMIWLGVLNAAYMLLQNLGIDFIFYDLSRPHHEIMKNIGFMGLKCFMGMLFAFILPFVLYYSWILGIFLFIPIMLSQSSIAIISACAVFGIYSYIRIQDKLRILIPVISVLLIFCAMYTFNDSKMNMMTDRLNVWKLCLKDAFKKPITGWGLDSFRNITADGEKNFNYFKNENNVAFHGIYINETGKFMFPKEQQFEGNIIHPWDNPHNEYVTILFEFGLFGIVLLVLLARDIYKRFCIHNEKQLALILFFISFAICSIAQFPAHIARLGIFLPVMLGIYYKLTDEIKGELEYGS